MRVPYTTSLPQHLGVYGAWSGINCPWGVYEILSLVSAFLTKCCRFISFGNLECCWQSFLGQCSERCFGHRGISREREREPCGMSVVLSDSSCWVYIYSCLGCTEAFAKLVFIETVVAAFIQNQTVSLFLAGSWSIPPPPYIYIYFSWRSFLALGGQRGDLAAVRWSIRRPRLVWHRKRTMCFWLSDPSLEFCLGSLATSGDSGLSMGP